MPDTCSKRRRLRCNRVRDFGHQAAAVSKLGAVTLGVVLENSEQRVNDWERPFVNEARYRSYAMLGRARRGARWGASTAAMPRFRP